jgi:hypothetical protein
MAAVACPLGAGGAGKCSQVQAASVEGARVCRGRPSSLKRSASTHPTTLLTLLPCHGHEPTTQPTGCLQDRLGLLLRQPPTLPCHIVSHPPTFFCRASAFARPFRSFDFIPAPRLCRTCSLHAHHCRSFTFATLLATLNALLLVHPVSQPESIIVLTRPLVYLARYTYLFSLYPPRQRPPKPSPNANTHPSIFSPGRLPRRPPPDIALHVTHVCLAVNSSYSAISSWCPSATCRPTQRCSEGGALRPSMTSPNLGSMAVSPLQPCLFSPADSTSRRWAILRSGCQRSRVLLALPTDRLPLPRG